MNFHESYVLLYQQAKDLNETPIHFVTEETDAMDVEEENQIKIPVTPITPVTPISNLD